MSIAMWDHSYLSSDASEHTPL